MELYTPGQREPTPKEREDFLTDSISAELRQVSMTTFQQIIALKILKRGDYDEKSLAVLAKETLAEATEITLAAVDGFDESVFRTPARKMAKAIQKRQSGFEGP